MLGAWIMELFIYMFNLIMATHYPTSAKTKEIYRYDGMNNCLIDICNIWFFSLGWCGLCWRSTVCISCINYQGLFSFFPTWCTWYLNLEYMMSSFWRSCCIALHCITWHCIALHYMAFGVMSRTYGCDRTGIASFIGHNDAASYLVGYEGRSSYASIRI